MILLDLVDSLTTVSPVEITGSVVRTPSSNRPIVVTATGGASTATDTAESSGRFGLSVPLRKNAVNALQLIASDDGGAISDPVAVTVRHDDRGPAVAAVTPGPDGVEPNVSAIQIRLSEPAVLRGFGAGVLLLRGADTVSGVATLSADSLTFTFTPTGGLRQNSVYAFVFDGVTDLAGNPVVGADSACFVTRLTSAAQAVRPDETNDLFGAGATFRSPSDLSELRWGLADGELTGVFKFTTPRSYDSTALNNLLVFIEIDVDQDSTTGYVTFKDDLFSDPSFADFATGIRAEYLIGLDPFTLSGVPEIAGFSYTGLYGGPNPSPDSIFINDVFLPGFCRQFVGFATLWDALGPDDGNFDYVLTTFNLEGPLAFVVDPTPTAGHLTETFAGLFPKPTGAVGVASRIARPGVPVEIRRRIRRVR